MAFTQECCYCRTNCNDNCDGANKRSIENAVAPYKKFKDKWEPLVDLIYKLISDPYYKAGTDPKWSAVITKFKEIRKAEREEILATLTEEQRKGLGI